MSNKLEPLHCSVFIFLHSFPWKWCKRKVTEQFTAHYNRQRSSASMLLMVAPLFSGSGQNLTLYRIKPLNQMQKIATGKNVNGKNLNELWTSVQIHLPGQMCKNVTVLFTYLFINIIMKGVLGLFSSTLTFEWCDFCCFQWATPAHHHQLVNRMQIILQLYRKQILINDYDI